MCICHVSNIWNHHRLSRPTRHTGYLHYDLFLVTLPERRNLFSYPVLVHHLVGVLIFILKPYQDDRYLSINLTQLCILAMLASITPILAGFDFFPHILVFSSLLFICHPYQRLVRKIIHKNIGNNSFYLVSLLLCEGSTPFVNTR